MQLAKSDNMDTRSRRSSALHLAPGESYVIQDLEAGRQLNGLVVKLFAALPDIDRCIVVLPGGLELSVKFSNLRARAVADAAPENVTIVPASQVFQNKAGRPTGYAAAAPAVKRDLSGALQPVSREELQALLKVVTSIPAALFPPPYMKDLVQPAGLPHATVTLLEPELLSTVNAPEPTVPIVSTFKDLTPAQAQIVTAAQASFEHRLPTGTRQGFFLADGWGTGKTRALCQLVLENTLQGRRRHLWIAATFDQYFEVQQELKRVSQGRIAAFQLSALEYDPLEDLGYREGVCFVTYALLQSLTRKMKKMNRVDQMIDWVGKSGKGSYEGLVIFEDWWRVKPLVKDSRTTTMMVAVEEIQTQLPQARVVYTSSSLLWSPRELHGCFRLGLSAPNVLGSFVTNLEYTSTQLGYEEFLAILKNSGRLLARYASLAPCVAKVLDCPVPPVYHELINASYLLWSEIWAAVSEATREPASKAKRKDEAADSESGSEDNDAPAAVNSAEKGELTKFFWNSHATYFRSLALFAKIPQIKDKATDAIKCGAPRVVISLFHLGDEVQLLSPAAILESVCVRLFPEEKRPDHLGKPMRSTRSELKRSRPEPSTPAAPAQTYEARSAQSVKIDDYGVRVVNLGSKPRFNLARQSFEAAPQRCLPVETRKMLKRSRVPDSEPMDISAESSEESEEERVVVQGSWYERISRLANLPTISAIDALITELGGVAKVAELSARKHRFDANGQRMQFANDSQTAEKAELAKGGKKICILADSQVAGLQLHSADQASRGQPVTHIFAELPLIPFKALWHASRTYRTGTGKHVDYLLMGSALGGDKLLAYSVLRIMKSVGLSESHIENARQVVFYYDVQRAKHALDFFLPAVFQTGQFNKQRDSLTFGEGTNPAFLGSVARLIESLGWHPKTADRRADSGRKFYQRLIGLPVEYQLPVFTMFFNITEQIRLQKKVETRSLWEE